MKPSTEAKDDTSKSHQSPSLPSQEQPQPVHQSDADEEDESVKQLGDCSSLYLSLQDCLIKTDRNWKSCQKEVQALKTCNEGRKRGN
ncbi:Cytochrome c oxidase assembly factor 4-like protein mitochondrial [Bienertia sinuspersici]